MLIEGSSLGRIADNESFPTEKALERIFIERFKTTSGMVLVACSAQNVDRVVTIYRAAKQTGRTVIVDAYAAEILKATGYDTIPKPVQGWPNLAVYIPQAQRVYLKRKGIASIVDSYRGFRLWPEQLAQHAPRSVMLFRGWMLKDFERAGALGGVESLISLPALMTHASTPREVRTALGITDNLVRISVGIEDCDDLIADLNAALG